MRKRAVRVLVALAVGAVGLGAGLWWGVHNTSWMGPCSADSLRAVVGPKPVAYLEDAVYGVADSYRQWRHADAPPRTYWTAPVASSAAASALPADGFPPPPVTPLHPHVADPGDGIWSVAAQDGKGTALLAKTIVHPDPERPYAALAVVAMDLKRVRLHARPGTLEPREPSLPASLRTGLVEPSDVPLLLAVFNGGFQTIHGNYGMMVRGHRLGTPQRESCTVAIYADGTVRIRPWPEVEPTEAAMTAYRQTPECLVHHGQRHPALVAKYNTHWGAALGGQTVIRRSALGVSQDGRVVFFGMGDSLTARTLADGMSAAGASDVAQLDINHAFPRFVFYQHGPKGLVTSALCPGFTHAAEDFVERPMNRDFFYVTRLSSS